MDFSLFYFLWGVFLFCFKFYVSLKTKMEEVNLDVSQTSPCVVDIEKDTVKLICVLENRKLRVRFHSYTDINGKIFTNVYDNTFNCQFPTSIREEGRMYAIHKDDMSLIASPGKKPFYNVRQKGIRILGMMAAIECETLREMRTKGNRPDHVYEVTECVICFEEKPAHIFLPCAHLCTCAECYKTLKRSTNKCPLCRRFISNVL